MDENEMKNQRSVTALESEDTHDIYVWTPFIDGGSLHNATKDSPWGSFEAATHLDKDALMLPPYLDEIIYFFGERE